MSEQTDIERIREGLRAGLKCAEQCPLNTTYHERAINEAFTALTKLATIKDAEIARLEADLTTAIDRLRTSAGSEAELRARLAEAEHNINQLEGSGHRLALDNSKQHSRVLTLESQCHKMRDALAAVQDSEFGGIECNDVNGQNWFDVRTKLLSAPLDLELLNRLRSNVEDLQRIFKEWDRGSYIHVAANLRDDYYAILNALLKSLSPSPNPAK